MIEFSGDLAALAGRTAVVPTVSTGNVGQLAVDLLVSSLRLPRAGVLRSKHLPPLAGAGAFAGAPDALVTTAEVFAGPAPGPVCVQLRAPPLQGHREAFARALGAWLREAAGVARVVLLSGNDAGFRPEAHLAGAQTRVVGGPVEGGVAPLTAEAPFAQAPSSLVDDPEFEALRAAVEAERAATGEAGSLERVVGGGLAKALFAACGAGTVLFATYCHEGGDNAGDARATVEAAAPTLGIRAAEQVWVPPPSWEHLLGGGVREELYS